VLNQALLRPKRYCADMTTGAVEVRELEDAELPEAFEVVRQLRGHLSPEEFLRRVAAQRLCGYRAYGVRSEGRLVGFVGFRPVATLARGDHLHVDDLVVDRAFRGHGIGTALLAHAEAWAEDRGLEAAFLDSRSDALGFYSALAYEPHTAVLVRKRLRAT